jgi:F-type H+-transporting ATPase subunit b
MLVEDLGQLPAPERRAIGDALRDGARLDVSSAFPLGAEQREGVLASLRNITGHELACETRVDESLLAGARITLGAWVLRANLRDELEYFEEATGAAR